MAKKIIFFLFFIKHLCCNNVIGQVTIDTVTIQEKKYIHHHLVADHNTQNKDFFTSTEFLENITSGQIQQNTPGGLQTFLHHGLGNRHLSVLWQGINIQSVINGSYDLSLIPIDLMSNVSFIRLEIRHSKVTIILQEQLIFKMIIKRLQIIKFLHLLDHYKIT